MNIGITISIGMVQVAGGGSPPPSEDGIILYYSDSVSVLANLTFPITPTVLPTTFN